MASPGGHSEVLRRALLAGQILVVVVVATAWWSPALGFYFSQDDFPLLLTSHPGLVSPRSLLLTGAPNEYRPLTQHVFFWLNQVLFGLDPRGHHAATLVVHLGNAVLVGLLARRWVASWAMMPAGLAFALHPVHFFEATWVSGINQSGCVLFMLASLLAFDGYLRSGRGWRLASALGAGGAALLCKEDAVMLPVLVTGLALVRRPRLPAARTAWAVGGFWALLGAYLALRFGVVGLHVPSAGPYRFGLDRSLLASKASLYTRWLMLSWPFAITLGGLFLVAIFACRESDWHPSPAAAIALLAAVPVSVAPTLLVPSSAGHYLSVASGVLALAMAGVVRCVPARWGQALAFAALALAFGVGSLQERNRLLASRDLSVPIPEKAGLCRTWVEGLRATGAAAKLGCAVVLRDAPLQDWERGWLAFLPMVAWQRPLPLSGVRVLLAGEATPAAPVKGCVGTWSLTADGVSFRGVEESPHRD